MHTVPIQMRVISKALQDVSRAGNADLGEIQAGLSGEVNRARGRAWDGRGDCDSWQHGLRPPDLQLLSSGRPWSIFAVSCAALCRGMPRPCFTLHHIFELQGIIFYRFKEFTQ